MMEFQEGMGDFPTLTMVHITSDVLSCTHRLILSLADLFKLFHGQQGQSLPKGGKVLPPKENYQDKGKQSDSLSNSFQLPLHGSNTLSLRS